MGVDFRCIKGTIDYSLQEFFEDYTQEALESQSRRSGRILAWFLLRDPAGLAWFINSWRFFSHHRHCSSHYRPLCHRPLQTICHPQHVTQLQLIMFATSILNQIIFNNERGELGSIKCSSCRSRNYIQMYNVIL